MKNVPNLRFQEFSEEWETTRAENIFRSITDKKHDGNLLVLSATQDRGVIPRNETGIDIKYEKENLSSYKRVKYNDYIISLRSFQGGIEHSKYEGLVSPAYTVFNFKDESLFNHDFFAAIFKSQNFINRLNTLTYGIRDGKAISFTDFSSMKLIYPKKKEQEKIASFFSLIDKKIELQTEKVEELKNYKKGIMQKIFSQELRFKDENGNEYPEWEHTKLSQVAEIYQPQTISQQQFSEKGYPVYGANGVIGYFTEYNHLTPQIAVTCRGNTCGTVNLTQEKSWITGNAMVINTDNFENKVEKSFIFFLLQSSNLSYMITGSGQPQLTREVMNLHKIWLPCIEEQIKISHLLSALTNSVQKEKQKLNYLAEYKKGLLQQMFV